MLRSVLLKSFYTEFCAKARSFSGKAQFVEWLMGWGKFPAGGVKGGKHFYPGVKSPLSIVAAQAAINN